MSLATSGMLVNPAGIGCRQPPRREATTLGHAATGTATRNGWNRA